MGDKNIFTGKDVNGVEIIDWEKVLLDLLNLPKWLTFNVILQINLNLPKNGQLSNSKQSTIIGIFWKLFKNYTEDS